MPATVVPVFDPRQRDRERCLERIEGEVCATYRPGSVECDDYCSRPRTYFDIHRRQHRRVLRSRLLWHPDWMWPRRPWWTWHSTLLCHIGERPLELNIAQKGFQFIHPLNGRRLNEVKLTRWCGGGRCRSSWRRRK